MIDPGFEYGFGQQAWQDPQPEAAVTCRHCDKPIRREQREWASTDPLDGAPWYCRGNRPGDNRHEPAEAR